MAELSEEAVIYGKAPDCTETASDAPLAVLSNGDSQAESKAIPWDQIEKAANAGIRYPDLAKQFAVTEANIRKRASRYGWAVNFKRGAINPPVSQIAVTKARNEPVKELVTSSLAAIAERHPLRMASFLERKISQTVQRDTLEAPQNWKELATADTLLRRSLGLDKPQQVVSLNLWSSPSSIQAQGPVRDVESWVDEETE